LQPIPERWHHFEGEVDGYQTDLNYERNVEADLETALENARKRLDEVRSSHNLMKGNLDEFAQGTANC
jgi:hypothetical protein